MNFMMAFDVILLLLGAYLVYAAVIMKKNGNIPSSIVPAIKLQTCRDEKGFAKYLFPWVLAFALASFLFGLVSLGLDTNVLAFGDANKYVNTVVIITFLLMWGMFSYVLRKGYSKFC
ncbi:MAG: hypothetical protein K6G04_06700 [Lachnospiraceae bacterium]|nr:hypothetical protein [Lachnospiraceae bacterium]